MEIRNTYCKHCHRFWLQRNSKQSDRPMGSNQMGQEMAWSVCKSKVPRMSFELRTVSISTLEYFAMGPSGFWITRSGTCRRTAFRLTSNVSPPCTLMQWLRCEQTQTALIFSRHRLANLAKHSIYWLMEIPPSQSQTWICDSHRIRAAKRGLICGRNRY